MNWSDWLVETGSISVEQLEDAVKLARLRSIPLPDALLSLEYADGWSITLAFSRQYDYPVIDFYSTRIPEDVIRAVPDLVVRDLLVCPMATIGPVLWYASLHIADASHRDRLCHILNRDARPMWASSEWVRQAEQEYYSVCHVSAAQTSFWSAKYCDDDWLLVPGNRYRESSESGRSERSIWLTQS